jgi:ribosomal protein S18 acetylase RimI-like enzyme
MERTIGGAAAERMERYGELHARHGMDTQHIYLIDVGVHPQFKGQGHGSRLMGHVIGLSEAHPDSIGVALDTANPANLAYYQGFGFGVKASDWLKSAQLCFMFRANGME